MHGPFDQPGGSTSAAASFLPVMEDGMRISGIFAAAVVSGAALFSTAASAAGPFDPFRHGNWKGGAYTSSSTGQFSHCAASVRYKSGVYVSI